MTRGLRHSPPSRLRRGFLPHRPQVAAVMVPKSTTGGSGSGKKRSREDQVGERDARGKQNKTIPSFLTTDGAVDTAVTTNVSPTPVASIAVACKNWRKEIPRNGEKQAGRGVGQGGETAIITTTPKKADDERGGGGSGGGGGSENAVIGSDEAFREEAKKNRRTLSGDGDYGNRPLEELRREGITQIVCASEAPRQVLWAELGLATVGSAASGGKDEVGAVQIIGEGWLVRCLREKVRVGPRVKRSD